MKDLINKIDELDNDFNNIEKNKNKFLNEINMKKQMLKCISEFRELTNLKINIFQKDKNDLENIFKNFDNYLIFISAYISYAPILNKKYRHKLQEFIYNNLLTDLNKINFLTLMYNFLNIKEKDSNFYFSLFNYDDDIFISENLFFLYHNYNKNKVNYFLNNYTQICFDYIKQFYEDSKDTRAIIKVNFNDDSNGNNFMFEQIKNVLSKGMILFIENVNDFKSFIFLKNLLYNDYYINENGKKIFKIGNKEIECENNNYKIFISLNENISDEFYDEMFVTSNIINFKKIGYLII
jgi:hypothetical protein